MTKMFRTKADVDNLAELRRRRAALAERMKEQRKELNQTYQEIREELKPNRILQHTLDAFAKPADHGILGAILQNPTGLRLVTDFAITALFPNIRGVRVVRALAPAVLQSIPGLVRITKNLFTRRPKTKALPEPAGQEETEHGGADGDGIEPIFSDRPHYVE